jgi:hypothetical protein
MRSFSSLFLYLVLSVVSVFGSTPVVIDSNMRLKSMTLGNQGINLLVFTIDFDQPVFVNSADSVTLLSMSNFIGYNATTQMPRIIGLGGFASYKCANIDSASSYPTPPNNNNGGGGNGGPPAFLMLLSNSVQPPVSFLAEMGGHELANDTLLSNRVAFGLIINNGNQHVYGNIGQDLLKCPPQIIFSDSHSPVHKVLVNANNEAFTGTVSFTSFYKGTCDASLLGAFLTNYNNFRNSLDVVTSQSDLQNIQFQSAGIAVSDIWGDCINAMQGFFTYTSEIQFLDNMQGCFRMAGDPLIATDPCCNMTLMNNQCCLPQNHVPFGFMRPSSFNGALVNQCVHPDGITYILENFAESKQAIDQAALLAQTSNTGNLYNQYSSFMQQCSTLIFNTPCKVDSDCKYSKKCDSSFSGNCAVNWGSQNDLLLACYLDQMPKDLMYELSSIWGVPYFADPTQQLAAFSPKFTQHALDFDCVGPQSQPFQSIDTWDQVNQVYIKTPGNQTGCLAVMGCNWNSWQNTNQASCMSTQVLQIQSDHLCGLFDGIQYQEYSQQPVCRFTTQSQTVCGQIGGTWISNPTPQQGNQPFCFDKNHTTSSWQDCLSGPMCSNVPTLVANLLPGQNWIQDPTCSSNLCYNMTLTQQQCFNLRQQYMNDPNLGEFVSNLFYSTNYNACVRFSDFNSNIDVTSCNTLGFQVYYGKTYSIGKWYNQTECARGVCSVSSLQQYPVSASQCNNVPLCSQPCARCQAQMNDQSGNEMMLCYSTQFNTSTICQTNNGQWDFNRLVCTFPGFVTQASCTNNVPSAQFFTCNSATTQATCSNLTNSNTFGNQYLQCNWNDWAQCRSATECTNTGRCNDFELSNWNGFTQIDGVCVRPWQYDQNGNRQFCQSQTSSGQSTGIGQTKLGCDLQSVVNASGCALHASDGYQWIIRATDQTTCINHGSACFPNAFDSFDFNTMSSSVCTKCNGNFETIYQYTQGTTIPSAILPLTWVARQWAPVNQWKLTISFSKMNGIVQEAVTSILAREQLNSLSATYNRLIPLMQIVACDCLSNGLDSSCFTSVSATIIDVECRKDPGTLNNCGPLSWNSTIISNTQNVTSTNVQVVRTMAGPFLLQFATRGGSRRLLSSSSLAASYAVVQNNHSTTVGQLTGDGFYFNNATGTATVCLTQSLMISIVNSDFVVPDFVVSANNVTLSPWLNANITTQGLQLCASVSSSGMYFPILRVSNPQTYVSLAASSSFLTAQHSNAHIIGMFIATVIFCLYI